ncbi:MAG: GGDEF domain-containing phosphodiesterase, partial [Eubacteriales bacterium]|nr:GGDEF domain-containing phosphodiesterase [Eubacteriales bacterium]
MSDSSRLKLQKKYYIQDKLTGVASMECFVKLADDILACTGTKTEFVFLYFNIDNFKAFNGVYGYEKGDVFLVKIAQILEDTFHEYIVGRPSDDRFVVLANKEHLIEKIDAVHDKVHRMQEDALTELNTGIYEYENGIPVAKACDRAKIACDTLKGNYSVHYSYYEDQLSENFIFEKYIVDHLDEAIEQEYLKVYYQPVWRVMTDKVCSMESLVRWDDPKLGFLSPGQFIPILENKKLINKIDLFVIERVCKDIVFSEQMGEHIVPISVNISRLDFQLCDIYKRVVDIVEKYNIAPKLIHIEITESALNKDEEYLVETIGKFRKYGFEVWLDDFGSEYSTLNKLQNFTFDVLKIDMKFFSSFDTNDNAKIIVMSIIDMAKRLHLRTLAEGIETTQQYEFLKKIGCDKAQGYLLCRPKPLSELYGDRDNVEYFNEADFYDAIGGVNVLSPNPIAEFDDKSNYYQSTPIAIVQYRIGSFKYLFGNDSFILELQSMGVHSLDISEKIINDNTQKLRTRLESVTKKAHASGEMESIDFIYNGCQVNIQLKEIVSSEDSVALFVNMINLSKLANYKRTEQLETSMNFLYSIYDRVDLFDMTDKYAENIYMGADYYQTIFKGENPYDAVKEYADKDIAREDKKKFLEFYDFDTLNERLEAGGRDYVALPIRTNRGRMGIHLQLYIIIRVIVDNKTKYLSCVRDMGIEYAEVFNQKLESESKYMAEWYQMVIKELSASIFQFDFKTGKSNVSSSCYRYMLCRQSLETIMNNKADLS